jgi:hypothetical protein
LVPRCAAEHADGVVAKVKRPACALVVAKDYFDWERLVRSEQVVVAGRLEVDVICRQEDQPHISFSSS